PVRRGGAARRTRCRPRGLPRGAGRAAGRHRGRRRPRTDGSAPARRAARARRARARTRRGRRALPRPGRAHPQPPAPRRRGLHERGSAAGVGARRKPARAGRPAARRARARVHLAPANRRRAPGLRPARRTEGTARRARAVRGGRAMTAPAPVRKRRRWVKVLLVVAAVLVLARLALGLALPSLADLAVRDLGWTARLQGSSLSLLGGSFELRGLELRPRSEPDAAEPFARVAIARVDADMSALLRGELRVHHATIDGVELTLVRDAEGRWQVPMPPASEPQAEEAEEPATPGEPALDFGLPVVVETV